MKTVAHHIRLCLAAVLLLASSQGAIAQSAPAAPEAEAGAHLLAPAMVAALAARERRQAAQLHRAPGDRAKAALAAYLLAMRAGCGPGQCQGSVPAGQAQRLKTNDF